MRNFVWWLLVSGLTILLVIAVSRPAWPEGTDTRAGARAAARLESGAEVGQKTAPPSRPASFVGTIITVVPESHTLIVDVPLGADTLRIGAKVTPSTRITAAGEPISFESLVVGSLVRLQFRRVTTGNEAIAVDILREPQG